MEKTVWQRGKYKKFYAKMKIRIGGKDSTINQIERGDDFEYDGSVLRYAGAEIQSTQLRGAIEGGWASTTQDDDSGVEAYQPVRDVAKSKTTNRDLSRVQRSGTTMGTDSIDEDTVLNVSDRGKMENAKLGASPRILTRDNNRKGMMVDRSEIDAQDGIVVARVGTAAKSITDVTKASPNLADSIENRYREPIKEVMHRGRIVNTEGVSIKMNVAEVDKRVIIGGEEEGVVVGKVRHTDKASTEGIEIQDTSNIRNEKKSVKPEHIDTKLPPRIRMARRIDPSFPADWSFTGRLADRLKAAKDRGATPVFLEALYAAEGDQMRKALERAYPKQFAK